VPTYEYECGSCHRTFEIRQRISEPALTTCDVCGGPVRRLLSPAPFILKGEGWYVTDYPSESRKKALTAEKSGSSTSADASEKKTSEKKTDKADTPASSTTSEGSGTSGGASASSTPKSD
jgi:putative FmdB family regulatory protein